MPTPWNYANDSDAYLADWGRLQVVIADTDVTFFRDVPTQVRKWGSSDPFDDATALIFFPQLTPFESLASGGLSWYYHGADVDIYRVPPDYPTSPKVKLWEGMAISTKVGMEGTEMQCIGALHQLDLYVRAPSHLVDQARMELLIAAQFGRGSRIHLHTGEMVVRFPDTWTTTDDEGNNVTGHLTRYSGSWNRPLTGYIQDLLALMQTDDGSQWTVMKDDGRIPVLKVKDATTVDWTVDLGAPGVEADLTNDETQAVNVVYGEGSDAAGITWRNAVIARNRTGFNPLAARPHVHPPSTWVTNDPSVLRIEAFYNYGSGLSLDDGIESATKTVDRDQTPGWFGTIVLKTDPAEGSRLDIKAGTNIKLRFFHGTKEEGMLFHIAEATVDFDNLTTRLKVDTKARDLLTLEQIRARNRDSKTPSRLLQVNRRSQLLDDTKHPWDYDAGAGYLPMEAVGMARGENQFPWESFTQTYPPSSNPEFYVYVPGASSNQSARWVFTPVLASEKGTVRLTEIAAYDASGNLLAVPFHVSIYQFEQWASSMPHNPDTSQPDPFFDGAFDAAAADEQNDPGLDPPNGLIIGWGDGDQKAGYHPGLESEGDPVTGKMRDEGTWSYELDKGENRLWVAIYCESNAYFQGRLYKGLEV